jgi:leucyl-tRNA synthetase
MLGGIEKMSKSKNNVVEPRDIIAKFGADTARLFTMFAGPPDQSAAWSDTGAEGRTAILRRLWNFAVKHQARIRRGRVEPRGQSAGAKELRREVHTLLRQISHDYDRLQYNTVVSGAMKLLNALEAPRSPTRRRRRSAARRARRAAARAVPGRPHIGHGCGPSSASMRSSGT